MRADPRHLSQGPNVLSGRARRAVLLFSGALMIGVLVSSACGGDDGQCVPCDPGQAAVWCGISSNVVGVCGPDKTTAELTCVAEYGGTPASATVCGNEPSTTDEAGENADELWEPGRYVNYDPSSGTYIIDQVLVDDVKHDPDLLHQDLARVRQLPTGHFTLVSTGELTKALGWRSGDTFMLGNGEALDSLDAVLSALISHQDDTQFTILVERGRELVELNYIVE